MTAGLLDLFTDDNPVRRLPWATVALVLLNTLVFTWSFFFNDTVFLRAFEYSMPAWLYIDILFFGFQLFYAWLNIPGVAWFAHIGGFGSGFVSAFFLRQLNTLLRIKNFIRSVAY